MEASLVLDSKFAVSHLTPEDPTWALRSWLHVGQPNVRAAQFNPSLMTLFSMYQLSNGFLHRHAIDDWYMHETMAGDAFIYAALTFAPTPPLMQIIPQCPWRSSFGV